ncbi:MAG: UDP-N-acetylglucosamine 2-epimerase (non-hydrolyzing) [Candidatus Bathyarchaeota archaeon]|nr:UDP-N-acetylglucosamine 2-epimerase (non-hydrolyzing) [Candidatus Bathyarchaeota archaeon]
MKPVMVVAGTRPEVIKLAPVIEWLKRLNVDYVFIWSGQHYDYLLSGVFFEEFGLSEPDVDLRVGSGSHAEQTASIMLGLERVIRDYSPSIIVAEGDTNTVLASALVAAKCLTPFAHIEAGLRSWSMVMPEEVNRRVADAIASLHFAPTKLAAINLLFEGVSSRSIRLTGNTIVDVIHKFTDKIRDLDDSVLSRYSLERYSFIFVTLHRAENTDNPERLESILKALDELSQFYPVVFPAHPRTRSAIAKFDLSDYLSRVRLMDPLGYLEFLALLINCRVVLTDSGSIQEEAFTLKIPTVTLRYNTERPETTLYGINVLAGAEKDRIIKSVLMQVERYEEIRRLRFENPLGDGQAGKRIAHLLSDAIEAGLTIEEPDLRETPVIEYWLLSEKENFKKSLFDLLAAFDEDGKPALLGENASRLLVRIKGRFDDKDSSDSK